jgi:hypothetical protein
MLKSIERGPSQARLPGVPAGLSSKSAVLTGMCAPFLSPVGQIVGKNCWRICAGISVRKTCRATRLKNLGRGYQGRLALLLMAAPGGFRARISRWISRMIGNTVAA